MKKCTRCPETDLTKFSKRSRNKDGLSEICKLCKAKSDKQYRDANKEKIAAKKKEWCEANKDHLKAKKTQDYLDNTEAYKARARKSAENNSDTRATYMIDYYKKNKNIMNENFLRSVRKRRAMKLSLRENYTRKDETITRLAFNHKCFNCGSTKILSIDHHVPLSLGAPLAKWNAVLLCRSCNSKKGFKLPQNFYTINQLAEIANILRTIT